MLSYVQDLFLRRSIIGGSIFKATRVSFRQGWRLRYRMEWLILNALPQIRGVPKMSELAPISQTDGPEDTNSSRISIICLALLVQRCACGGKNTMVHRVLFWMSCCVGTHAAMLLISRSIGQALRRSNATQCSRLTCLYTVAWRPTQGYTNLIAHQHEPLVSTCLPCFALC